jgi:peptidyl-prolyl cis-trans isomerase C
MVRRATLVAALVAASACSGSPSSGPAKKGPIVAQGSGIAVTADELKARLDEQSPMIRSSFNSPERKKQFLDNMLRFELLARAAEKAGLANDPDVQFTMKKVMVSRYYQRFFQEQQGAAAVPDEEVKKYYDEHQAEFHRPARLHAAHVFFKAEAAAPDRAKKKAEAKKLLAKVLADEKKNPGAFSVAARESSEDAATKPAGGDLGFKTEEELGKAYGAEVASAVVKLKDNETSAVVLETPKGFHLLRLFGRQPEMNRTLEDAKPQIAARLNSQRKSKEFDDLVKKLRDDAKIQINEAELAKVTVSAPPAGAPGPFGMGGSPHGMPPAPGAHPPAAHPPAAHPPAPAAPPAPAKQ